MSRWQRLPVPNGTYLHDSHKGQIGFVQKTPVGGTIAATLNLAITVDGVQLVWSNVINYEGLTLTRNGAELAALAGDRRQHVLARSHERELHRAHDHWLGTSQPRNPAISTRWAWGGTTSSTRRPDSDPAEMLQYNPVDGEIGELDGLWASGNGSDEWDGSAPGEIGDPGVDPLSASPGGIALVSDGALGAYLIEDTGDPGGTGWDDPSNRKIYPGLDLNQVIESQFRSLISDVITVRSRFRLTPSDRAVDVLDAPNGLLPGFGGKGFVSIVHDIGGTGLLMNSASAWRST